MDLDPPNEFAQLSNVTGPSFEELVDELFQMEQDAPLGTQSNEPSFLQPQQQQPPQLLKTGTNETVKYAHEEAHEDAEMNPLDHAMATIGTEPSLSTSSSPVCPAVTDVSSVQVTEQPHQLAEANFDKLQRSEQASPTSTSTIEPSPSDLCVKEKVDYMKECLGHYENAVKENGCNGKIQVHQVVIFILLSTEHHSVMRHYFDGILVFCDASGKPSNRRTDHFLAKDTKTMGEIWKQVKNNNRPNFDTFARAMRVGREKDRRYFEYLEGGKGTKKRVYKLGPKGLSDMEKMEGMLSKICH